MGEAISQATVEKGRHWGKWGPADALGTLNYITPRKIAHAARLITRGKVFALGRPLQRNGPQSGTRQRFKPVHWMFRDGGDQPTEIVEGQGYGDSDAVIIMPLRCVTQWDSLAHGFDAGKLYNGYDATSVTSSGTTRNSLAKAKGKIVRRGALLLQRGVLPSAQRGRLGDLQALVLCGGGACLPTGARPHGRPTGDGRARGIFPCDHGRVCTDPTATWGYDS